MKDLPRKFVMCCLGILLGELIILPIGMVLRGRSMTELPEWSATYKIQSSDGQTRDIVQRTARHVDGWHTCYITTVCDSGRCDVKPSCVLF